jgi:elongation factor G
VCVCVCYLTFFYPQVERAVRVLDGCVLVLDASVGVQAQTMTVWRQTNAYGIPAVVYANKMDKASAFVCLFVCV